MLKNRLHILYMVAVVMLINRIFLNTYMGITNLVLGHSDWWKIFVSFSSWTYTLILVAIIFGCRYFYRGDRKELFLKNNLFFIGSYFLIITLPYICRLSFTLGNIRKSIAFVAHIIYILVEILFGILLVIIDFKKNKAKETEAI